MQFPIGVFGVSLAAATLPRVSRQWVERDAEAASRTITQSLRHVFAINLPASAGLAFLSVPIIQLIFEYGQFSFADTEATAAALVMYSVGLTAYSAVKVLVPACYAMGNTRLPVMASVLTVGVTVALNLAMIGPLGYRGLALGTSLGALFNFAFLAVAADRLLRGGGARLPLGTLGGVFFSQGAVALTMGIICLVTYRFLDPLSLGFPAVFERAAKLAVMMGVAVLGLLALGRVFRLSDTTQVFDLFASKLKKKLSRKAT
jgi:putative peptidoglycan lipid II flippase